MTRKYTRKTTEERFWKKVKKTKTCWLWTGAQNGTGYGVIGGGKYSNDRLICAHRLSYILKNNSIFDNLCILHKCDNKLCVNPAHLFMGTNKDNTRDMYEKGRALIGDKHPLSKLTEQQVKDIRKKYISMPSVKKCSKIAKTYNISTRHLRAIINHTKRNSHYIYDIKH